MLLDTLYANDGILFFDEDFANVTFSAKKTGIICIDLNKVDLDDVDFDEGDPETIIYITHLAWRNKFEKRKAKRYEQRFNAFNIASYKMLGLVLARR